MQILLSATLALTVAILAAGHMLPDGYETFPTVDHPHPTSAYKLHREYKTWEQAGPICNSEGGHLIVVNSQAEADIARTLIGRTTVAPKKAKVLDQFHVGMHCKGHIGHWVTVLGGNFLDSGWTNWAPNQPSPDHPRPVHCGALLRSMQFNNLACSFHLSRFICEKTVAAPPAPPIPQPTQVPANRPAPTPRPKPRPRPVTQPAPSTPDVYETFPFANTQAESSYKLHREHVPWEVANAACEREGARLVVVNSEAEAKIVALIFGRLPPSRPASHRGYDVLHVGITDKNDEGNWVTVEGGTVASCGYNQWRRGEPDNHGGLEHCGGITRDKRLVDLDCISPQDAFPFVCEKDLNDVDEILMDIRGSKNL